MSSREQSTDPYVWAVLGVFGTCVSCVGLILNLICTVTWIKHGFRPSTIVYFIALSVIDSCMLVSVQLLFCFPALLPPDSYYDDIYAVVWSVVYPFEQVGLTSFSLSTVTPPCSAMTDPRLQGNLFLMDRKS